MPEILHVRVCDTNEELTVPDVEPLAAAVQFKAISDRIWSQKPEGRALAFHRLDSQINPLEARDAINEVVGEIDKKFVISGLGKSLDLGQIYGSGRSVVIGAEAMDNPVRASVETFNWDSWNTYRFMQMDGRDVEVEFTDGHTDYYRELSAKLSITDGAIATYTMQRLQSRQDSPTHLTLGVWHRAFAEMGYDGHQLAHASITEQQESRLLDVMQRMGGIAL